MKEKKFRREAEIPDGYEEIETPERESFNFMEVNEGDEIRGIFIGIKKVLENDRALIKTKEGIFVLPGHVNLMTKLAEVKKGTPVYIVNKGLFKPKGAKRPFFIYGVGVKPKNEDDGPF